MEAPNDDMYSKYVGKEVQVKVSMPGDFQGKKKTYMYHGKLLSNDAENVEIDDAAFGSFVLPKAAIITIRELNNMDYLYLANQFDVWALKLKARQRDEKLMKRLHEMAEKFRQMLHGDGSEKLNMTEKKEAPKNEVKDKKI